MTLIFCWQGIQIKCYIATLRDFADIHGIYEVLQFSSVAYRLFTFSIDHRIARCSLFVEHDALES